MREDEDVYSLLDSLKRVLALEPKKMFCSFSGTIENPEVAIHQKIEYLENLKVEVEKGVRRGLTDREIQRRLLGRGDQFSLLTSAYL